MKKQILNLTFLFTLLSIISCSQNETSPKKGTFDFSSITRPEPNYCKGCGNSQIAEDKCIDGVCMEESLGICPEDETEAVADAANVTYDLSEPLAYEIRDSFMINSNKGQEYITYFYEVGSYIYNNNLIDATNIVDFLAFAHMIYDQTDVLRNGSSTDIVVNSAFRTEALLWTGLVTSSSPPPYIANMITTIEADLVVLENKTKSQVEALL
ncbi:MAG: hypothetical protein GYB35_15495 [Algicola sp.]|nr:hypothetical protein [Algicola sp.]